MYTYLYLFGLLYNSWHPGWVSVFIQLFRHMYLSLAHHNSPLSGRTLLPKKLFLGSCLYHSGRSL